MLRQSFYSVASHFQHPSKIMQRRSFIIRAAAVAALTIAGPGTLLGGKNKNEQFSEMGQDIPAERQSRT